MKKLFTLVALLAMFMGAKAELIEDKFIDFSTVTEIPRFGWGGSEAAFARLSLQDGCLHFASTEATDPSWECQWFPIGGVDVEIGQTYTMTLMMKGDHAANMSAVSFGGLANYGNLAIPTDWSEVTVVYENVTGTDGNVLFQCGDYVGTWDIKWIRITHEGKKERPVEWVELLNNGDAEKSWESLGLADVAFDDMENNMNVCFWTKEKGVNEHNPHPAEIVELPEGGHAFICRATLADTEGDPAAWDNQIWIQSPRAWKTGEQYKLSFRYKASEAVKTNTQVHHQMPSDYLYWQAIGDIDFTTEWKTYEETVTVPGDANGMWSVAFNLNPNVKTPVDFYVDDISWSEMKLDHGYFIASTNTESGLVDYDYDNATEFEYVEDGEDSYWIATVGTEGNSDSYVNEVQISTVRGNDRQFKANTLKVKKAVKNETWMDYEEGSQAKIKLPSQGVWTVLLDPSEGVVAFAWVEGDTPKDPIDITPNATEVVVKGAERDWRGLNEDGSQIEEGGVGEGQAWDNQFWIFANRTIKADEEVVIEFDYMASREAKTTTQIHGLIDNNGKEETAYLHWQAIGDVNFTTEWQHFSKEMKWPADGAKTTTTINDEEFTVTNHGIAFNMAEIKEACDYTIKNVVFRLADETESLIDMEGDNNFWIKVGAGTAPYPVAIEAVTSVNKATTKAMYNLAGQRVSKDYKGIAIKNGQKFIVK